MHVDWCSTCHRRAGLCILFCRRAQSSCTVCAPVNHRYLLRSARAAGPSSLAAISRRDSFRKRQRRTTRRRARRQRHAHAHSSSWARPRSNPTVTLGVIMGNTPSYPQGKQHAQAGAEEGASTLTPALAGECQVSNSGIEQLLSSSTREAGCHGFYLCTKTTRAWEFHVHLNQAGDRIEFMCLTLLSNPHIHATHTTFPVQTQAGAKLYGKLSNGLEFSLLFAPMYQPRAPAVARGHVAVPGVTRACTPTHTAQMHIRLHTDRAWKLHRVFFVTSK